MSQSQSPNHNLRSTPPTPTPIPILPDSILHLIFSSCNRPQHYHLSLTNWYFLSLITPHLYFSIHSSSLSDTGLIAFLGTMYRLPFVAGHVQDLELRLTVDHCQWQDADMDVDLNSRSTLTRLSRRISQTWQGLRDTCAGNTRTLHSPDFQVPNRFSLQLLSKVLEHSTNLKRLVLDIRFSGPPSPSPSPFFPNLLNTNLSEHSFSSCTFSLTELQCTLPIFSLLPPHTFEKSLERLMLWDNAPMSDPYIKAGSNESVLPQHSKLELTKLKTLGWTPHTPMNVIRHLMCTAAATDSASDADANVGAALGGGYSVVDIVLSMCTLDLDDPVGYSGIVPELVRPESTSSPRRRRRWVDHAARGGSGTASWSCTELSSLLALGNISKSIKSCALQYGAPANGLQIEEVLTLLPSLVVLCVQVIEPLSNVVSLVCPILFLDDRQNQLTS